MTARPPPGPEPDLLSSVESVPCGLDAVGIADLCSHRPIETRPATARWCNGSTNDSGSFSHGSNPCRAIDVRFFGGVACSNLICSDRCMSRRQVSDGGDRPPFREGATEFHFRRRPGSSAVPGRPVRPGPTSTAPAARVPAVPGARASDRGSGPVPDAVHPSPSACCGQR